MNVTITYEEKKANVSICGRIDTTTVLAFRKKIEEIDFSEIDAMSLDFSGVEYVSSAGLRELLKLRKRFQNDEAFRIVHVNEAVMDVFITTGFHELLNISVQETSGEVNFSEFSCKDMLAYKYMNHPEQVFLTGSKSCTWKDVEIYSQIIAKDLHDHGVTNGTHVGICGVNSANWIFTYFAIQKLGAIAVLINSAVKERDIVSLSQIGDITHLCMGDMSGGVDYELLCSSLVTNKDCLIKYIVDIRSCIDFSSRADTYRSIKYLFSKKVDPDEPAIMIFGSGSTGAPKGVLHSNYNLVFATLSALERIEPTGDEVVCNILPLFHIFGLISGIYIPIVRGVRIFIPENYRTGTLLNAIYEGRITALCAVPTMLLALTRDPTFDRDKTGSIKMCVLGGSGFLETQFQQLTEKLPETSFFFIYGLSELAPASITSRNDTPEQIASTVGLPCKDVQIRIATKRPDDPEQQNRSGEILARGANMMICYYKMKIDEQTIDSDGWLHTGDLGFLDDDGYLHITGRIKDVIVCDGENVLPKVVVAALMEHPAIADARVIGTADPLRGEIVNAAIIIRDGCSVTVDELNTFLNTRIAKYMIPSNYIFYNRFPMLANKKVDVAMLRKDIETKRSAMKTDV